MKSKGEEMRFIGDIHGKYLPYIKRARKSPDGHSIQVGDFGVGFGNDKVPNFEPHGLDPKKHRFIRGNHDNPTVCAKSPSWILDGTQEGDMYFLGGAESIDQQYRIEGVSWWRDEELSQERMWTITSEFYYNKLKPRIMVTHDAPCSICQKLFGYPWLKFETPSRTQQMLDSILAYHKPYLHIFGHWHEDKDEVIDGTRFICLGELSYIDIDMNDLTKGEINVFR
jgi:hypothetical protein